MISGQDSCEPPKPTQCYVQGECQGELAGFNKADDVNECLDACQTTANCTWFSYNQFSSLCFQLRTCDQLDSSAYGYISGEVTCPPYQGILSDL